MNLIQFLSENPNINPQVTIEGIGTMSLQNAITRVNKMFLDLAERSQGEATLQNWNTIKTLMDRRTLNAYIESITLSLARIN